MLADSGKAICKKFVADIASTKIPYHTPSEVGEFVEPVSVYKHKFFVALFAFEICRVLPKSKLPFSSSKSYIIKRPNCFGCFNM